MKIKKINEEVLYTSEKIVKVSRNELDLLTAGAKANKRHRMRLCAHPDTEDTLHEMFIAIKQGTYIKPHKHLGKSESFHVIEGAVDVVLFDDDGSITEVSRIADYASGGPFYHRISEPCYHTLLIRSDYLLFHEITNGPFQQENTLYAPWAPDEADHGAVKGYIDWLLQTV